MWRESYDGGVWVCKEGFGCKKKTMSHQDEILRFRETIDYLLARGRKKTDLQKESKLDHYKFKEILTAMPAAITIRSSILGRLQDFNKKYAQSMVADVMVDDDPVLTPEGVKPEKRKVPSKRKIEKELAERMEKSRKELIMEFMEKLVTLCEDYKPDCVDVSIVIK